MRVCVQCGAANEDVVLFCANCGALLETAEDAPPAEAGPAQEPAPAGRAQNPVKLFSRPRPKAAGGSAGGGGRRGLFLAAGALLALIAALLFLFSGRSADDAAAQAVRAVFQPDTERVFTRLAPARVLNKFLAGLDFDRADLAEQCADMDESIREVKQRISDALGANLKFTYRIRRSKDFSSRDLRALRERYQAEYGVNVRDAKLMAVRVTVKAGRQERYFDVEDITVLKVGRSWYVELRGFASSINSMRSDLNYLF